MKHARPDYDRIQDPAGLIPDDEPVFLLRGQDAIAADVVRIYGNMLAQTPGADQTMVNMCHAQAEAMSKWPKKKVPDLPKPVQEITPPTAMEEAASGFFAPGPEDKTFTPTSRRRK